MSHADESGPGRPEVSADVEDEAFDLLPPAPRGPHPTPDEIYRARTEAAWGRAAGVLAHVAACAVCTEEALRQEAFDEPEAIGDPLAGEAWERFQKLEAMPGPPVAPSETRAEGLAPVRPIQAAAPSQARSPRPVGTSRRGPLRSAFLLAATLAACAAGVALWRLQVSPAPPAPNPAAPVLPTDTVRGGQGGAGAPGGPAEVWSPAGELSEAPREFLFPRAGTAARRVTVYDAARSYFWTSPPSAEGRVVLPESERSRLRPGVDYFWTVLGDEASPSEGAALSFRLAEPAGAR